MIVLLEWCLPRLPLVVENNEEDKSTLYSDLIFLRKMCSFFVLSRDSLFSKISQILSLCIIKLEFLYSLWCKFRQPTSLFSVQVFLEKVISMVPGILGTQAASEILIPLIHRLVSAAFCPLKAWVRKDTNILCTLGIYASKVVFLSLVRTCSNMQLCYPEE